MTINVGGVWLNEKSEREVQCSCGRKFKQWELDTHWLASFSAGKRYAYAQQVPSGLIPVFCGPCERRQLNLEADRAAMRREFGGIA